MKTRIVMWGSNEKEEKILIAIGLRAEYNEVDVYTFPFETTTEEFYNLMLNEWRDAHEVPFPEGYTHIKRPLTAADSILPPGLKIDRDDVIQRAQTEWHFVVLSSKLYQSFRTELSDILDKLKLSDNYDGQLWEDMKQSWERIQKNIFDKTLMRDHGQELREMTNDIFTQLKNKRKSLDSEADRISSEFADKFNTKLDGVEEKIKSGLGLQPLFNDLKRMQQEFKAAALSRADRSKIWKRIDNAFKAVKEKKFGEKGTRDSSTLDRLSRRLAGLLSAIEKMERSIRRDDKDKSFQDDRIANTEGQLEAQIRLAKIKMIDERLHSKNEKLEEMLKTKEELESRIQREKKYQEDQKKQQVLKEEIQEAKETVKQKIADTIHAQADTLDTEALEKAAEAIAEQKAGKKSKPKESMLGAIGETLGESLTDLGDSLGAVASVLGDQLEHKFKELKEDAKEKAGEAEDLFDNLKKQTGEKAGDMKEGAKHLAQDIKEKAQHITTEAKELAEVLKEKAKHVKEELKEKADKMEDSIDHLSDESKEKIAHLQEEAKEKVEKLGSVFNELKKEVKDKLSAIKDSAKHIAEDISEEMKEHIDDLKTAFEEEKGKEDTPEDKKEDQA